ncbi:hypothetical protein NDU88_007887 [Pleurodeles waltl]|uniref:Uncharacterized protein n=1 Tax=Pleurodeles waltl TaxID=8319 RepID=A0AAV7N3C7_PLEWA|nr:hypothetical protein NDU88_007887 [Pleurodeles waltl]
MRGALTGHGAQVVGGRAAGGGAAEEETSLLFDAETAWHAPQRSPNTAMSEVGMETGHPLGKRGSCDAKSLLGARP